MFHKVLCAVNSVSVLGKSDIQVEVTGVYARALIAFDCAFYEQGLASVSKFLSMRLTVRDLSDQNHL
jgi:hypothetical protein